MKKLGLIAIMLCIIASSAFAAPLIQTAIGGNGSAVTTLVIPIAGDFSLRTGIGLQISETSNVKVNSPLIGVTLPCSLELDANLNSSVTIDQIGKNYTISLNKRISYKLVDNVTIDVVIGLLTINPTATSSVINVLTSVTPQISVAIPL